MEISAENALREIDNLSCFFFLQLRRFTKFKLLLMYLCRNVKEISTSRYTATKISLSLYFQRHKAHYTEAFNGMDSYIGDTPWSRQLSKSRRIQPGEFQRGSHWSSTPDDLFAVWRWTKKLHRYTFSYTKRNKSLLHLLVIFDRFLILIANVKTTCISHSWLFEKYNLETKQI